MGTATLAATLPYGEHLQQVGELALALLLAGLIGIEREVRQKNAGFRTYTLVGVGAALFMLLSKYGFNDVLQPGLVVLDPSRVAAQIVVGVSFLGAGLIFVRRDSVRGLTTAAAIWLTAAIGAAAGAGLALLATLATVVYFIVTVVITPLVNRLPRSGTATSVLQLEYPDHAGVLRDILQVATSLEFEVSEFSTRGGAGSRQVDDKNGHGEVPNVEVVLQVHGPKSVYDLATALLEIQGVRVIVAQDVNAAPDNN